MPANFGRIKDWVAEILTYEDLNREIDNILENLDPSGIGDFANDVAQYQSTVSPIDGSGNPVLPNSLAGEIQRLRYQIQAIIGSSGNWYDRPTATLTGLAQIVFGNSVPNSRIESIGSTYFQNILVPSGSAATVTLKGSLYPVVYYVQGIRYSLTTDAVLTGMSVATGGSNTALVTETAESGLHPSSYLGEHDTTLLIGTVGTSISSSSGIQAFKVVRGGTTEFFTAQYLSDATDGPMLEKAQRGKFYNGTNLPVPKTVVNTGDTVTFQKLAWIFLKTDGTLTLTYNTPTWSLTQPATPSIGDFWFDLSTTTWKSYSALGYQESGAVYIGQAILDTGACIAARSQEPFKIYSSANELELDVSPDGLSLKPKNPTTSVSVYGLTYYLGPKTSIWNAANLETPGALAASTTYYAYIKESGDFVLSTISPTDRRGDLAGYYHPSFSWRCLGHARTNGSSLFYKGKLVSFSQNGGRSFFSIDAITPGEMKTMFADTTTSPNILAPGYLFANGGYVSRGLYRKLRSVIGAGVPGTYTLTGTTSIGSATVTTITPTTSAFTPITGLGITGTGIQAGTTISSLNISATSTVTSIVLSAPATAAGAVTLTIGVGNGTTTFALPSMARTQGQWTQYVPNVGGLGVGAYGLGEYRIDGDEMEVRFTATVVNTVANGNSPSVSLPSGIAAITFDTLDQINHTGYYRRAGNGTLQPLFLSLSSGSTSISFYYLNQASAAINPLVSPNPSGSAPAAGDTYKGYIRFRFSGGPTFGEQKIIKAII